MPKINERRFRYACNKGNINSYWFVYGTMNNDKRAGIGKFQDIAFRCLHLNKNYYFLKSQKI